MAYDDARFRGETAYRDEPDTGAHGGDAAQPGYGVGYAASEYPADDYETTVASGRAPTAAQLGSVFDDPKDGAPGQDRIAVHMLWETVLLLFSVAVLFLLRDSAPSALRGSALRETLVFASVVGLLAVGAGLTLRAAVPNLAIGTIGYACATFFATNSHRGLTASAAVTVLVAVVVGIVLSLIVVGFHVPGWAGSLGAALAIMVWLARQHEVSVVNGAYEPARHGMYWFAAVAAIAVVGGLFGLIRPLRRAVGRFRSVGDPATRRGAGAGAIAVLAIVGSTALAAAAGILLALDSRQVSGGENGLALTGLALGAALLGGTSAFGRRGGVLGTVLAVVLLVALMRYGDAREWKFSQLAVGAAAILAGLVVTRLIEAFGRPRHDLADDLDPDDELNPASWSSTTAGAEGTWPSESGSGGWTAQLPPDPADESWRSDERWGGR